ncbi:unnamed protein product [Gadus morhua 'NCC']
MKMNPWTLSVLLLLAGPLGADPDWHVEYPDSFCVVEGSTATIPCSFTHPAGHRVERVVWCANQVFCNDITSTPNVYDSNVRADSRFQYLGDLVGNCTLKIIKTVKQDAATYRFRFETNYDNWAGRKGVVVNVTGPLGADPDWHVEYPDSFCVVEGSTATIPCSFTHPAGLRVERVVWCPYHLIFQGFTPNVYDSRQQLHRKDHQDGQPLDRNMRSSTARSFTEPNSSSDSSSSSSDDEIREH